ncbi:MAG: tRNA (N(6)-L-threonylcarbamoyladenosine(37)-C(2))-methylthiotransferase [Thermoplasmatota archaeon]
MRVYIETYGCTANKYDESIIKGVLKQHQHQIVDDITDADTVIILTCTVIGTTEQRMISRLKLFIKTKKKIIITGCMPSVQKDLLIKNAPTAVLLSLHDIHFIDYVLKGEGIPNLDLNTKNIPKYFPELFAPISIAQGCLFSCSYCITHLARGKLHSFSKHQILTDVHQALQQGCKEIFLTAQDTASYGIDTGDTLADLLQSICTINNDFRVRIGMMNPATALKNLDSIITAYKHNKIYKFIHLPVQSGNDILLKQMNRTYTIHDFKKIISKFRKFHKNICLSTDIIVGYPGETDEQFDNSVTLVKEIRPDIVNITRFSPRPLTKAKTLKNKVPTDIVKKRSKKITLVCKKILSDVNKEHIGNKYSVLITKHHNGFVVGRSDNYKPVLIKQHIDIGERVSVEIVNVQNIHLVGKLI